MTFEKRKQINTNWAKVNMSIGAFWLLLTNKCQDRDIFMLSLLLCGHTPKHWKIQITRWNGSFSTITHLAYWTNGFICIKTVHYLLHPSQDSCHVRKMSRSWAKIKWHDGNYIYINLGKNNWANEKNVLSKLSRFRSVCWGHVPVEVLVTIFIEWLNQMKASG